MTVWDWSMSSRILDYDFQKFQPIANSLAQLSYMVLRTIDHLPDLRVWQIKCVCSVTKTRHSCSSFLAAACINASRQNHRGDYGLTWWSIRVIFANNTTKQDILSLNTYLPFDAALQLPRIPFFLLVLPTRSGSPRPCLLHCCLHWLAFRRITTWPVCSASLLRDWHHNVITVSVIIAVGYDYGEL